VKSIYEYCHSASFDQIDVLSDCARESCIELEKPLVASIVNNQSYEKLNQREYIPIGKSDFYGYRRKTIYLFYNRIKGGN
jgi:hypothetical protein